MASPRLCLLAAAVVLAGLFHADAESRAAQPRANVTTSYGAGVHSFFAGSYQQADAILTRVIESGGHDPRAYYFRAMARLRLGRQAEAAQDMRIGAALEAMNPGQQLSVSQALQRVQGYDRQTLEKYRRSARVDLAAERSRRARARYEGLEAREAIILRSPESVSLDSLLGSETEAAERVLGSAPPVAAQPTPAQPMPAEQPEALFDEPEPAVVETVESDDAFDLFDEPQPAEPQPVQPEPAQPQPAMEDDPFGAPPETDPFGAEPEPAADDPFGAADEPEPAMPAEDDPFGEPSQPAEDASPLESDPFGAGKTPTPAEPPAAASLDERSKVQPRKLMGVLGRVIGRASPFSGMSVPQIPGAQPFPSVEPMPPMEDTPFDFGPAEEESAVEADTMNDDPFGDFGESEMTEDDPFGAPAEEEETAAEPDAMDDDPFGDFSEPEMSEDDPFAADDPFGDSDSEESGEESGEEEDPFDGF